MIKKKNKVFILLFIAAVIGGLFFLVMTPKKNNVIRRVLHYTLTARNLSGDLLPESKVHVFAPREQTAWQIGISLQSDRPYSEIKDSLGNRMLEFLLTVPPYGSVVIPIQVILEVSTEPMLVEESENLYSIQPEVYIESDNAEVIQVAQKLRGKTDFESAKNIQHWVSSHMKSNEYIRNNLGALHALRTAQGDCTEHAYLFVALARALGIPARPVGGFYLAERTKIRTGEYHNWAEFYAEDTPYLADPLFGNFNTNQDKYVSFRLVSSEDSAFAQTSQRFLTFDPKLEVTLN